MRSAITWRPHLWLLQHFVSRFRDGARVDLSGIQGFGLSHVLNVLDVAFSGGF